MIAPFFVVVAALSALCAKALADEVLLRFLKVNDVLPQDLEEVKLTGEQARALRVVRAHTAKTLLLLKIQASDACERMSKIISRIKNAKGTVLEALVIDPAATDDDRRTL